MTVCKSFVLRIVHGTYNCLLMVIMRFPDGVMVKELDCGIVVSEFELQFIYRINTLGKGMNHLILPTVGSNGTTTVLQEGWLWH